MIHVSVDQGETWNMAQLPPVGHEQFYSILAANDDMVFMHVDEPGGQSTLQLPMFIYDWMTPCNETVIMLNNNRQIQWCVEKEVPFVTICHPIFFPQILDLVQFMHQMTKALCTPSHWSATFTPPRGAIQISPMSPPCEGFSSPASWLKVR